MRVAILGCGSIGRRHATNLRTHAAVDLVLFDPDPRVQDAVSKELELPVHGRIDAIWAREPVATFVTAPSNLHVELADRASRAGTDLFVEKPLSHSLEGVASLVEEVEMRGLVTMVGCNMRFHPGPATVKRLLDDGVIGEPISARIHAGSYLPDWRPWQDYKQSYSASAVWGGAILDMIHEIDLALWYFGPAMLKAACHRPAATIGLETDGVAELILQHESGTLASVHLNFVQRDYRRFNQIFGTRGSIYWDFERRGVEVYGTSGTLEARYEEPADWELNRMYVDEVLHFLECVETRAPTMNPLRQGAEALRIAVAARNQQQESS